MPPRTAENHTISPLKSVTGSTIERRPVIVRLAGVMSLSAQRLPGSGNRVAGAGAPSPNNFGLVALGDRFDALHEAVPHAL